MLMRDVIMKAATAALVLRGVHAMREIGIGIAGAAELDRGAANALLLDCEHHLAFWGFHDCELGRGIYESRDLSAMSVFSWG
jgi:hypothetical protein